jgi:hypothetical protein
VNAARHEFGTATHVDCGDLSPLFPVGDLSLTISATGRRLP